MLKTFHMKKRIKAPQCQALDPLLDFVPRNFSRTILPLLKHMPDYVLDLLFVAMLNFVKSCCQPQIEKWAEVSPYFNKACY